MKKTRSSAQRKRTAVKDLATRTAGGVKGGNVRPDNAVNTAGLVAIGAAAKAPDSGLATVSSAQTAGSRG
jgi:hypothetical protein